MQKKRLSKQKTAATHYKLAVIGEWHLAFTTATCLASLGHKTLLVNSAETGEKKWGSTFPKLTVHEPGLSELITKVQSQDLLSHADGLKGWTADIVWLAIDTPVNENDEPDTSPLERVAQKVAKLGLCKSTFAVSSQVPVGFCDSLSKRFGLDVAYIPENLRLGVAIETFMKADRTVVGANSTEARTNVLKLLRGLQTQFVESDLVTAEMIKHATNAFLATSISFANEMARIGETMGVDNQLVAHALKLDKRIGQQAYLAPGLGFAGGTLPRDLQVLQKQGKRLKVPTPLVDAVLRINQETASAVADALKRHLGTLKGKKILLVGYTYKPNTDTLRRSPAIDLARALKKQGTALWGFDPVMNDKDLSPLRGLIHHFDTWGDWDVYENGHGKPTRPDAVVVMTPRPSFQHLDWRKLKKPSLVLDARSMNLAKDVLRAGCTYKALWQPAQFSKKH